MSTDANDLNLKIKKIEEIKNNILRHTTILTDNLQIISPYNTTPPDAIRNMIREIRTIINEINKLKPYCDEKSKKSIELFSESGADLTRYTSRTDISHNRADIEHWASKTVGISFDYAKYPFHISTGLEYEWKDWKFFIEMSYKRLGFPGGWKGGLTIAILAISVILAFLLNIIGSMLS